MDRQIGEIGARVRAVREGRALTQQEVAERSGLGPEQISRIENGRRRPRAKTLRRLAEALGVAVEYLTTGRSPADETRDAGAGAALALAFAAQKQASAEGRPAREVYEEFSRDYERWTLEEVLGGDVPFEASLERARRKPLFLAGVHREEKEPLRDFGDTGAEEITAQRSGLLRS